jgi:hypothetical protein
MHDLRPPVRRCRSKKALLTTPDFLDMVGAQAVPTASANVYDRGIADMTTKFRRILLGSAVTLAAATSLAIAADQTIRGKAYTVKSGSNPSQRKVVGVGTEKNSANTLVGNPTAPGSAGGAILELSAAGANPSSQSFTLPQGVAANGKPFWVQSGNITYKYKDPKGEQGPVKAVIIKRSLSGSFSIRAIVSGRYAPLNVVPPNPGVSGCMALDLGISPLAAGDRYSVQFGPDGKVKNNGAKLFQVKKPTLEGICPGTVPTTTSTTIVTTTTTSTTTTTIYGSPSRAFLVSPADLLD